MEKKFVGIGGGEILNWNFKTKDDNSSIYQTSKIDKFIVDLSKTKNPKLLFIGTASKENEYYLKAIKSIYEKLNCIVDTLKLLDENVDANFAKQKILSSDIIYIGGGKTNFLFEKLREFELDKTLVEAYNKGIVVSGFSAGCYSFFEYNYELLEGFGVINAISIVHFDEKSNEKKELFKNTIKNKNLPGIALDNGTAIYYYDNKFKIIKSIKDAKAYISFYKENEFITKELEENIEYELN